MVETHLADEALLVVGRVARLVPREGHLVLLAPLVEDGFRVFLRRTYGPAWRGAHPTQHTSGDETRQEWRPEIRASARHTKSVRIRLVNSQYLPLRKRVGGIHSAGKVSLRPMGVSFGLC